MHLAPSFTNQRAVGANADERIRVRIAHPTPAIVVIWIVQGQYTPLSAENSSDPSLACHRVRTARDGSFVLPTTAGGQVIHYHITKQMFPFSPLENLRFLLFFFVAEYRTTACGRRD